MNQAMMLISDSGFCHPAVKTASFLHSLHNVMVIRDLDVGTTAKSLDFITPIYTYMVFISFKMMSNRHLVPKNDLDKTFRAQ